MQYKSKNKIPVEIQRLCEKVTAKRARTVIDHILKHGFITTEELKNIYNYDHPPRAIRDVREHGIPLKTYKVVSNTTGRKIAAYKFDSPDKIKNGRIGGRLAFSKLFKSKLVHKYDSRCTITCEKLNPRYLQIDHRIPYEIAGNEATFTNLEEFMLLDASAQRIKSWTCEHCKNFIEIRDPTICNDCFWAYPENYTHIALEKERRVWLVFKKNETEDYDKLKNIASKNNKRLPDFIKEKLKKEI